MSYKKITMMLQDVIEFGYEELSVVLKTSDTYLIELLVQISGTAYIGCAEFATRGPHKNDTGQMIELHEASYKRVKVDKWIAAKDLETYGV